MARPDLLKLRSIGQNDYSVLEDRQRIGRIRLATERLPSIWLWQIQVHIPGAPSGIGRGPRHGDGGIQGGMGSPESQDAAGAARRGLQGDEHSGRWVKARRP